MLKLTVIQSELDGYYLGNGINKITKISKESAEIILPILNVIAFLDTKISGESDFARGQRELITFIVDTINQSLKEEDNESID